MDSAQVDSGCLDAHCIHHAVWCDNIMLYASDSASLETMIRELTVRLEDHGLRWKPSSLEILASDSLTGHIPKEFCVPVGGDAGVLKYSVVSETVLLGNLLDNHGSSASSFRHRQNSATGLFFKHKAPLQAPGPIAPRLRAWAGSCGSSALHGCETWHVTRTILQDMQTWEMKHMRIMFRMRPRPDEGRMQFNIRTADKLQEWCLCNRIDLCTHRFLKEVYKSAWREQRAQLGQSQAPLKWAREHRSQAEWQTAFGISSERKRRNHGWVHKSPGHKPAWEYVFCATFGPHWRSRLRECE